MGNVPKHCLNINDKTFTIYIDLSEGYSGWKSLSEWYGKSEDYLLTHWVPIIGTLFLTEAIYFQHFKKQLSQTRKILSDFSLHFINLDLILNILRKKMTLIADVFLNLLTPKKVVR